MPLGGLSIEGEDAFDFVTRFLNGGNEAAGEAALSLAMTRAPRAFATLRERWEQAGAGPFGEVLLTAIALTRLTEAYDFLKRVTESGPQRQAEAARRALDSVGATSGF